ncbi:MULTISPECIES: zinc ribbon domain-containing protein [Shewanella]|uniref:Zinc ribbon domain-containing protein n=1 Tax=Shewanella metallivivens TaxID=2872342 RepID=A0ABT5THG4_9GAMM|nr:zinc ribbon domain-containing protein [Shewanella metallivivens]MDD8058062.1 zinc ribbon domain-containing protein [Shewanella metallivivens]
MALVACPKCQKRISSQAKQCQHCKTNLTGNTESLSVISHIERSNSLMNQSFIFLTLFIAGVVVWFWGGEPAQGLTSYIAIASFVIGFTGYLFTRVRIVLHKRKSV